MAKPKSKKPMALDMNDRAEASRNAGTPFGPGFTAPAQSGASSIPMPKGKGMKRPPALPKPRK